VLEETGLVAKMAPISTEKVTNARALYFDISSDLVSENYFDFGVLAVNILIIELLIFLFRVDIFDIPRLRAFLIKERIYIYWGLVVSNMVQLILPWKYIMSGGSYNFATKTNSAAFHAIYMLLLFLASFSFVMEIKLAKKSKFKQNYIKVAIRKWWTTY
jgi:hypothetical protein